MICMSTHLVSRADVMTMLLCLLPVHWKNRHQAGRLFVWSHSGRKTDKCRAGGTDGGMNGQMVKQTGGQT